MGDLEVNARASLGAPRPSRRADSPPEPILTHGPQHQNTTLNVNKALLTLRNGL
jgi:hypothetical protein